jgi:hypothetical protein
MLLRYSLIKDLRRYIKKSMKNFCKKGRSRRVIKIGRGWFWGRIGRREKVGIILKFLI